MQEKKNPKKYSYADIDTITKMMKNKKIKQIKEK